MVTGRIKQAILMSTLLIGGGVNLAMADPQYAISMYGDPALPPDFVSLPYANPSAPKGGSVVMGEVGGFDSLNPHILKGRTPWQLRFWANETLMGRSWDEPFTLYGLLAETIDVGPNREWVEFTLRPEAKFSDGSPVTIEDVLWSYETLGTVGHYRYRGLWEKIEKAEQTGPRSVKFTFNEDNPELALLAGMRPILKKSQWDGRDFTESGLDIIPISSAPYVIDQFDPGRSITLKRDPNYWGKDLPFRRGTDNFDEISIEYFGDATVLFEAFKAGDIDMIREGNAEKWETEFDFPAVQNGQITKSLIPHERPTGMRGLVMNTRRALFADWRVRQAMIEAFNFEFINDTQNGSRQERITSYFSNSQLGMRTGTATGAVLDLLTPFKDTLLPDTIEGYTFPVGDGSARNRANMRKAAELVANAGYKVSDGILIDATGTPVQFEILLRQGAQEYLSIAEIYVTALERLGIKANITLVDGAQYTERSRTLDFDMMPFARDLSLSPGNEQILYWSSNNAELEGTRNMMGVKSDALDAMLDRIMTAKSLDELNAITRAMDRILTAGRFVIPIYHDGPSRIAHKSTLKRPEHTPIYGDRIGYFPDVWWHQN
jgi:peptide/nickel transport system substrate-binding protein